MWPGFWLLNHDTSHRPENDIMEAYPGGGPSSGWEDALLHPIAYSTTVWRDSNIRAGSARVGTPDLSADFHVYGMKWQPSRVTFYFDGHQVYQLNISMSRRMYIILSLWYGSASGTADSSAPAGKGNAYEIQYVRVWK